VYNVVFNHAYTAQGMDLYVLWPTLFITMTMLVSLL
jgi:hypothetical protein